MRISAAQRIISTSMPPITAASRKHRKGLGHKNTGLGLPESHCRQAAAEICAGINIEAFAVEHGSFHGGVAVNDQPIEQVRLGIEFRADGDEILVLLVGKLHSRPDSGMNEKKTRCGDQDWQRAQKGNMRWRNRVTDHLVDPVAILVKLAQASMVDTVGCESSVCSEAQPA